MKSTAQQRGFSFSTFIVSAVLFVVIAIFTLKMIPVYMENGKVQKAFDAMVKDPALQNATTEEIKMAFQKRANVMDSVTIVQEQNLEIFKEGNQLSISAKYNVKVPLFSNVSLLIEFNPSAPK